MIRHDSKINGIYLVSDFILWGMARLISVNVICMIAVLIFFASDAAFASDQTSSFSSANALYQEGRYAEAAEQYETILANEGARMEVLFNLGNARVKQNQLGRARAAYLKALWLNPRQEQIKHNLDFVNSKLNSQIQDRTSWYRVQLRAVSDRVSQDERWLIVLGILWVWLCFLLLSTLFSKSALLRIFRTGSFLLLCLVLMLQGAISRFAYPGQPAVAVGKVILRSGPSDLDAQVLEISEGMDVYVADRRPTWSRVILPSLETGWVPNKALEVLGESLTRQE